MPAKKTTKPAKKSTVKKAPVAKPAPVKKQTAPKSPTKKSTAIKLRAFMEKYLEGAFDEKAICRLTININARSTRKLRCDSKEKFLALLGEAFNNSQSCGVDIKLANGRTKSRSIKEKDLNV